MVSEITFGIPDNQEARVARIIYNAFEYKFRKIFGSENGASFISRHLRPDRTVVAAIDGIITGVGGLKFRGKEFIDTSFWQLLRELKFGIFRVVLCGWIFYNKVEERELLIDVLAVDRDMRGKGIGSRLVTFIIDFAYSNGYKRVKLFVTETNWKAKVFYERLGFREIKVHRIPFPWSRIFGFSKASEMMCECTSAK